MRIYKYKIPFCPDICILDERETAPIPACGIGAKLADEDGQFICENSYYDQTVYGTLVRAIETLLNRKYRKCDNSKDAEKMAAKARLISIQ